MSYSITIDTGGTFTDLVLADDASIRGLYKSPTTPDDPYSGILVALEQAAEAEGLRVEELLAGTQSVVYATTHATNAILEGRTARTAFLTTAGHRDILLYREGGKQNAFDLTQPYPEPYVPRSLTFEIQERVLCDGQVARPLDEAAVERVIERLRELDIEAVGVCLLWSISNPDHERRVGELLRSALPDISVTLSHELNPKLREYRRASSTVIDASLKPLMRAHLRTIDERLRGLGFRGEPLMVTHMSGGVLGLGEMCERPIHAVDSGPALAPVAVLVYARADVETESDRAKRDVLVIDAGGTSVDISPTRDGRIVYSREKWLGERWKGHMTGLPAVETNSIGAGGGSIASVDADGLLRVGPRSAGARPGPACYDQGGEHATVTDAALLLGYLDPEFFLGGRMRLVPERAQHVLTREVAEPLGLGAEDAAVAVMTVFSESLRSFLSEMTIVQGLDPRDCLLVAGGGAAGLNIVSVARELRVDRVVVPTLAAGLSALGGQFADVFSSFGRSVQTTTIDPDRKAIGRALEGIEHDMQDFFERVAAGAGAQSRELICEARYANQLWELDVPLPATWSGQSSEDLAELSLRFDRLHRSLFSIDQPGEPLELLGFRGDARVARRRPQLASRASVESAEPLARRPVRFAGADGATDTPVYRGERIPSGARIEGPAVIEEATTTILLDPGAVATAAPAHYRIDLAGLS